MINIQINETTLLNLFMNRLEGWTSDDDVLALYEDHLKGLIYGGYFEGAEIDVALFVDNLYINDTTIMDRKMLDDNDIEVNDNDKVLARNEDKDLYLVSNY